MSNMLRGIERNAYREAFGQSKMGEAWRLMRGRNSRKLQKAMAQTLVAAQPKSTWQPRVSSFVESAKKAVIRAVRRGK
jgi:hypothetical protein